MAKGKLKKTLITVASLIGVIGGALGAGYYFMSKPKFDEKLLEEVAEELEKKVLVDIFNEGFFIGENTQIDFRYVHANNNKPIIGQEKNTVDIYGVLHNGAESYNFKTEYDLPNQKVTEIANAGDKYLNIIKDAISDMKLKSFDAQKLQKTELSFNSAEFMGYANNYFKDISPEKNASKRDFFVLMNNLSIEENKESNSYEVVYNLVGLENHFNEKGKLINQFTRIEQIKLPFDINQDYDLDTLQNHFIDHIKTGNSQGNSETLYFSNENKTLLEANRLAYASNEIKKTAKDYGIDTTPQHQQNDEGMGMSR